MGHVAMKDLYGRVGEKLDGLEARAPMNEDLYEILKEIFTESEAEIFCSMPYGLSPRQRIAQITGLDEKILEKHLREMSSKGLILDMFVNDESHYSPSPMIIGIFEFTMMRVDKNVNSKKLSKLFHNYLQDSSFFTANLKNGGVVGPLRTMPYVESIRNGEHTEVLDYEKAFELVEQSSKTAIGLCSCRHEKHHTGTKECDIKLDTCTTINRAADMMIKNGLAKEAPKEAVLENLAYSRENGLIILADNVQKNVFFLCQCCGCCCNALLGITKFGYPNTVVSSNYISKIDEDNCISCGNCVEACPIEAISLDETSPAEMPEIKEEYCLGCGVCALQCSNDAMCMIKREKRVLHPETTFERIILQCLERGTLHNQLFDDQSKITMKFLSGLVGGFFRLPPVKKALMSDLLRSNFLSMMKSGVKMQGKGWLLDL